MSLQPEPFLRKVAKATVDMPFNLHNICVVFPNRRAEIFYKKYLSEFLDESSVAPLMLTAEEFVADVTGMMPLSGTNLIFEAYESYLELDLVTHDEFEDFLKWANTALHDFNEIDRHLVNANDLFDSMVSAKTLERWGAETEDQHNLINRFLSIWKTFKPLYHGLTKKCKEKNWGWQGLSYRIAAESPAMVSGYMDKKDVTHFVFAGFNALNKSEEAIISDLLEHKKAHIYWDSDAYYLNDYLQEAGQFLRERTKKWSHFSGSINWVGNDMLQGKNVSVYSTSGSIDQAKTVGEILKDKFSSHSNTAVVLADENLLMPVLNSIPSDFEEVNVTMGMSLKLANPGVLVLTALKIKSKLLQKPTLYFKDLDRLLDFAPFNAAFEKDNPSKSSLQFIRKLKSENRVYLNEVSLDAFSNEEGYNIESLKFFFRENKVTEFFSALTSLMEAYVGSHKLSSIEREIYYSVVTALNELNETLIRTEVEVNFNIVTDLFKTALSSEQVSFYGEPLRGLQVMGILETRTLDFENVIMTTVNEGVLPSGKSNNSFIPYDVRRYYQMPVHNERDAIYAYHFYRLLQRAKNIHLIYNNTSGGIGGKEKSRFVRQIETEWANKGVTIRQEESSIIIKDGSLQGYSQIFKSAEMQEDLKALLIKGVSPTALAEYIRDPLAFYYSRVLGVREEDDIEEVVGHATLGSVVHDVLEDLYKPFVGSYPLTADFNDMRKLVPVLLKEKFERHYKKGQIEEGKNLLVLQVAQTMIFNFLVIDEKNAAISEKNGGSFKILSLESTLEKKVFVDQLGFEVRFFGKADRIEMRGNDVFVVDYKTGAVETYDLDINGLEDVFNPDLNKGKVLQLLMYAYLFDKSKLSGGHVYASVLSLRKWKQGSLKARINAGKKTKVDLVFDQNLEQEFEEILLLKICELYEGKTHFKDINVNSLELSENQP